MQDSPFLIQNDAVALGLLMVTLAVIFILLHSPIRSGKNFIPFSHHCCCVILYPLCTNGHWVGSTDKIRPCMVWLVTSFYRPVWYCCV